MTNTLIIYCHPYDKSFNHAVLSQVTTALNKLEEKYQVIDLYADAFDPRYSIDELKLYASGATTDPQVTKYLSALKRAGKLVIIAPIWWNDLPAMLKGFFDKVMKKGSDNAYVSTKRGIDGQLKNINSALVLTTSTSPTLYLKLFCGNAIKRVFIHATLKQLGIKNVRWNNFGGISTSTQKQRATYLSNINSFVGNLK